MSNISVNPENQQVSEVSPKVMEAVLKVIEVNKDNLPVVSIACNALSNLSFNEKNLRTLGKIDNVMSVLSQAGECKIKNFMDAHDIIEKLQLQQATDASTSSSAGSPTVNGFTQLATSMGFNDDQIQDALNKAGGDAEQAFAVLMGE